MPRTERCSRVPGESSVSEYSRLLDLETLQAPDLPGEDLVHVDVGVLLQLVLPDAEEEERERQRLQTE